MIKYKLVKDNQSIDFPSLEAVAAFKSANPEWVNIEAVSYEEAPEIPAPIDPLIQVQLNINKGKSVLLQYLADNKVMQISNEQSLMQLQKFASVKQLLEVGDLQSAAWLISETETDEVFTEERKQKYLIMLS